MGTEFDLVGNVVKVTRKEESILSKAEKTANMYWTTLKRSWFNKLRA